MAPETDPKPGTLSENAGAIGPARLAVFLIPSLLGAMFFLAPVPGETTLTIPLALVVDVLKARLAAHWPAVAVGLVILSAVLSTAATTAAHVRKAPEPRGPWERLLRPGAPWVGVRIVGAMVALMTFTGTGPALITSAAVGGLLLNELAPILIPLYVVAGLLIPLLTDYGLMEFFGVLLAPALRVLFRVPGRGAVDATASWMGSSTVGALITIEQYRAGHYTAREAAIIATNFSLCSVGFAYALAATVKVEAQFLAVYGTAALAALVAALILSRVPPLSRLPDTTIDGGVPDTCTDDLPISFNLALTAALDRARTAPGPLGFARQGLLAVAGIFLGLMPCIFAIGGFALLIADATPVFDMLSAPLVPVLAGLGLPDAAAAAPAFIVGLADQFLTVIVGAGVESEQTRFVIAVMAVAQLLYFSDLGALLIQSPLPIGPVRLTVLFMLRTVIILPLAAGVSHLLY